jgi:hypothetical protein
MTNEDLSHLNPENLFLVESQRVIIVDPCYRLSYDTLGIVAPVKNGHYYNYVSTQSYKSWGTRVTDLYCCSADYFVKTGITQSRFRTHVLETLFNVPQTKNVLYANSDFGINALFSEELGSIGVDSGGIGIFDEAFFKEVCEDDETNDAFYNEYANLTCWEDYKFGVTDENNFIIRSEFRPGGTLDKGVVTRSGFGDGIYSCFGYKENENDDHYIGFRVVFIGDDESCDT